MKLTGSTTVGWTISLPGKMPHVTALGCISCALVMLCPCTQNIQHGPCRTCTHSVTSRTLGSDLHARRQCDSWHEARTSSGPSGGLWHFHWRWKIPGRPIGWKSGELRRRFRVKRLCWEWPNKESQHLLEDISSWRSPAYHRVRRWFAIDVGLGVDGEDSTSVNLLKLVFQKVGLWGQRLVVPG